MNPVLERMRTEDRVWTALELAIQLRLQAYAVLGALYDLKRAGEVEQVGHLMTGKYPQSAWRVVGSSATHAQVGR